ncbi:hypothetical protein [Streptomyces sp. NBC_00658]|uniref:hypothetical protein n=1 Tax=Streptomyces sp. NBC_00658 TaxID=2975800 RepID=UPI0032513C4E
MSKADRVGRLEGGDGWSSEHRGSGQEFRHVIGQLEAWLQNQTFNLRFDRSLAGGASGAYVAAMERIPHRNPKGWYRLIVKLVPPDDGHEETNNFRDAISYAPEGFRSAHLVSLEEPSGPLTGDKPWWIHLQKVALGNLSRERVPRLLDLLDDPSSSTYCAAIAQAVIEEWNAGSDPQEVRPQEFLTEFLGERLARKEVQAFLADEEIDSGAPSQTIKIRGRDLPLPNPFALIAGKPKNWQAPVRVFRGKSHGDLHPRNILLPRAESGEVSQEEFQLIDLGRYSADGPLALDPMRLLLSVAAEWLPSLVPHSAIRSVLAELMVAPGRCVGSPPVMGYQMVAKAVHDAVENGLAQHGSRETWKKQNHLILVGCALRFFSRSDLAAHDRWWFLEVAALATRALIEDAGGAKTGQPTLPTEACSTGREPLSDEGADTTVYGRLAEVIPLMPTAVTSENRSATELAALVRDIERLPADATAARLDFMAISLRRQAEALADSLTDQRAILLRDQLFNASDLLSQFGGDAAPSETLRCVQQAGKRLRTYGRNLWPDEVG